MSESENFLARWSRLKRKSQSSRERRTEMRGSAAPSGTAVMTAASEDEVVGTETNAKQTFDRTSLPSIDSITATTDIRVFLQSGVPVKLTEAALRRAWASDPAIRDFIGIAENQWDFTNPTTIPGFGPFQGTGNKLSVSAQATGSLDKLSVRLPNTYASADKSKSATADSRRDELESAAREKQGALATPAVDREMPNSTRENGCVEEGAKNNLSLGSISSQRRRHVHGGALPRWDP